MYVHVHGRDSIGKTHLNAINLIIDKIISFDFYVAPI